MRTLVMRTTRLTLVFAVLGLLPLSAQVQPPLCEIASNFNGTPIFNGTIWFNAVLNVQGLNQNSPTEVDFIGSTITFMAGGTSYTVNAPNAVITFDPKATTATTTFNKNANQWVTTVPASGLAGNVFLDGVGFPVPAGGLPGGIKPVTWKGTFSSAATGIKVQWQWGAAVYNSFSTDYNSDQVKPVDDNKASAYQNSDHAGTTEAYRLSVLGGATGGGGANYTGSYSGTASCGTAIPPQVASCKPVSSLTTLIQGSKVTAYIPEGNWRFGTTGIQVVPIKPAGTPVSIPTHDKVNSCAANSSTGQVVCTANGTDVYLISGSTLTNTLTSGATAFASFSGGTCQTCGVAVNEETNTAVITIGNSSAPNGDGLQFLNLANNALSAPVAAQGRVSEDIVWDPSRNLILSPSEGGSYNLFDTSALTSISAGQVISPPQYGNSTNGELDAAAEDCLTGIALASNEVDGSNNVFIADLTQALFTPGSPKGTWTAGTAGSAQGFVSFPEFASWVGSSHPGSTGGIAVAPGSHLAVVTAEFGGNQFAVLQLPATSGTGFPAIVDYADATLPSTPDGFAWSQGGDPHTVTAYVDPNNGKAYGLMADAAAPKWLAVIDQQALLSAPRTPGTHFVSPSYDLLANGVVTYVSTH
jgi:hypothetical protein